MPSGGSSKSQITAKDTLRIGTQYPKSHWPLSLSAPKSQRLQDANATKSQTLAFYKSQRLAPVLRNQEKGVLAKGVSVASNVTPTKQNTQEYWDQQYTWHSERHDEERRPILQENLLNTLFFVPDTKQVRIYGRECEIGSVGPIWAHPLYKSLV